MKVRATDAELLKLSSSRLDCDQQLFEAERQLAEAQRAYEKSLRERLHERERADGSERNSSVEAQTYVLKEKRKQQMHRENASKVQQQLDEVQAIFDDARAELQRNQDAFRSDVGQRTEAAVRKIREKLAAEEERLREDHDEKGEDLGQSAEDAKAKVKWEQKEL